MARPTTMTHLTGRASRSAALSVAAVILVIAGAISVGRQLQPEAVPATLPSEGQAREADKSAAPSLPLPSFREGTTLRVNSRGLGDLIEAYPGDRLYVTSVTVAGSEASYQLEGPPRSGLEDASHVDVPVQLVEANAVPVVDPCPDPPRTLSVLLAIRPYQRALCFPTQTMTLPDVWLGPDFLSRFPDGGGDHLPIALADRVLRSGPGWVTVSGRFGVEDDSCGDPVGRLRCRERFVIDDVDAGASPFTEMAGTWSRMSHAPISGRSSYVALPTDRGAFIWGGDAPDPGPTGAMYQAATDTWTPVARAPGPSRLVVATAWTGDRVLIWGGFEIFRDGAYVDDPAQLRDGLAYDPDTDRWSSIPEAPIDGGPAVGAWTDHEFVVVSRAAQAAAWDPAARTWRRLPDPPIPQGFLESVWTGSELIVLGLTEGGNDPVVGASFDPAAGEWRQIAEVPYDGLVLGVNPTWTGSEMLFVHHAYDPSADTWQILSIEGCDGWGGLPGGVWADHRLLSQVQGYDPATGRCSMLPDAPIRPGFEMDGIELRTHEFHTPVWVDDRLIIWSGGSGSDVIFNGADGVVFTPAAP